MAVLGLLILFIDKSLRKAAKTVSITHYYSLVKKIGKVLCG